MLALRNEVLVQNCRIGLLEGGLAVAAGAGCGERFRVKVRADDLDRPVFVQLAQQDGKRIRLFARGAGGNPDTQGFTAWFGGQHVGQRFTQHVEGRMVAEKRGKRDKEKVLQGVQFLWMAPDVGLIGLSRVDAQRLLALFKAAQQRVFLVAGKVDFGGLEDLRQQLLQFTISRIDWVRISMAA